MSNKFLVIIPAFNETENLPAIIPEIRNILPSADILVIDDGSSDNTYDIAVKSGCLTVRHPYNMGDGSARHTGYIYAFNENYDFVVQIDADGQHPPKHLTDLLEPLIKNECDITIGSRFILDTGYKPTFLKTLGMSLFNIIATLATGIKITDSTSGFRAVNKKVIEFYCMEEFYPSHFPDADLIILSHFVGLRIKEVPVWMNQSIRLPMHRGVGIAYYAFKMLLSICVTLLREKPMPRKR
ncbi:MAG TPA: glycosyl transferase family 2 [Elusimicrobia bacterium]|nr:MAG: hypothetical protein A2278_01995 [Elusimicrobia bacterium RIFOXYA12_FULL_49_49]OGS06030.1 MAG: hypothetical protein A2204_07645 [Elusimicrobia bacterium RIFOXYA1_FULL_47_7]OGS16818.1 MAG: hypothetical protein A2251_05445 [Elusimicrobia bacterium RIFOXYA2_FULL_47_53]OGS32046.1 MAG: hypothetical protein A2323_08220 [Elusimicrobia bacterium RIFOXYB2_FULL_46_23]HBU69940.1 glycosyl transferase family 2 [Elusimicrobiota bacterium]